MEPASNQPVFRLGIVMAGAVSAGAYTAGVMDYLIETLQLWEEAKRKNRQILEQCDGNLEQAKQKGYDSSVPMHQVVLEALAGASAGGMTAAITALSLFEGMHHYREDDPAKNSRNRLYHSWVNLDDKPGKPTFSQMLDTTDIEEEGVIPSLLNSKPIDEIADRLHEVELNKKLSDYGYVSPDLNLVLTLCSLRGVPVDISFNNRVAEQTPAAESELEVFVPKTEQLTPAAHRMYLHKGVAQFCFADENGQCPAYVLPVSPAVPEHRQMLINTAKATGAFPIGLRFRKLQVPTGRYVQAQVERLFGLGKSSSFLVNVKPDEPFEFVAVDGGAINNEPIGEVDKLLEELFEKDCANNLAHQDCKNYGIIMIDPFPSFVGEEKVEHPNSMLSVGPKLLNAFRSQAMLKEGDIRQGFKGAEYTRGLIFPRKKKADGNGYREYSIACSTLDGFGGFLSRDFREHDFLLGRKNCQSFLRKYFVVKDDAKHPLLGEWTAEAKHRFGVEYEGDFARYLAIIPDVRMPAAGDDPSELKSPPDVALSVKEVCAFYPNLLRRTQTIVRHFFNLPGMIYGRKKNTTASSGNEEPAVQTASPPGPGAKKPKLLSDEEVSYMVAKQTGLFAHGLLKWAFLIFIGVLVLPFVFLIIPVILFLTVVPLLYLLITHMVSTYIVRQKVLKTIIKDLDAKGFLAK